MALTNCKRCLKELISYIKSNKRNLSLFLLLILIIFLILPIHRSTESKIFRIEVPYKQYRHQGSLDYKIQIKDKCPLHNTFNKIEFQSLSDMSNLKFEKYPQPDINRIINFSFDEYEIAIFGIEKCDCLDDKDIGFKQKEICILNDSRVFGYFREQNKDQYNFIPFVLDTRFQILSPNKKFKLSFQIEQTKEGIRNERGALNINKNYFINAIVTYPKMRTHPWAIKIAKMINIVKDPLKTVYDAKKEEWEYK